MFAYRQVLARMRLGDTDRTIARADLMGRRKAAQFRRTAEAAGWLDVATALPGGDSFHGKRGVEDRRYKIPIRSTPGTHPRPRGAAIAGERGPGTASISAVSDISHAVTYTPAHEAGPRTREASPHRRRPAPAAAAEHVQGAQPRSPPGSVRRRVRTANRRVDARRSPARRRRGRVPPTRTRIPASHVRAPWMRSARIRRRRRRMAPSAHLKPAVTAAVEIEITLPGPPGTQPRWTVLWDGTSATVRTAEGLDGEHPAEWGIACISPEYTDA